MTVFFFLVFVLGVLVGLIVAGLVFPLRSPSSDKLEQTIKGWAKFALLLQILQYAQLLAHAGFMREARVVCVLHEYLDQLKFGERPEILPPNADGERPVY